MRRGYNITDAHIHIMSSNKGILQVLREKEEYGYDRVNLLSLEGMGDPVQNARCMLFKLASPGDFIFGGLDHSPEAPDYLTQVKKLAAIGFDGMKMIEGKPEVRKKLGKPLDDPSFDGFYGFMEEKGFPLLMHVADPETFWDITRVPEFALKEGWFYGDGTFASKEQLYSEVDSILAKFPRLRVAFAHFYFLSGDLKRASAFLDRNPYVSFDITPGIEMYGDFSEKHGEWRDFFTKYQDRILFGTDNYDYSSTEEAEGHVVLNRVIDQFINSTDPYKAWDLDLRGIGLGEVAARKIYSENFTSFASYRPKSLDKASALEYCESKLVYAGSNMTEAQRSEIKEIISRIKA